MKRKLLFIAALFLVVLVGCSRTKPTEQTKESASDYISPSINSTENNRKYAAGAQVEDDTIPAKTGDAIKVFDGETLNPSTDKGDAVIEGLTLYKNSNDDRFYYDSNGVLRLILKNKMADMSSSCSEEQIKTNAQKTISLLSDVCIKENVKLVVTNQAGGYECKCIQTDNNTILAILAYDSAGDLMTANFDMDAYGKKDDSKYVDSDYVEAARVALSKEFGKEFDDFPISNASVKLKDNVIQGKLYKEVTISLVDSEGIVRGYGATVSQDDLSVKYTDMIK